MVLGLEGEDCCDVCVWWDFVEVAGVFGKRADHGAVEARESVGWDFGEAHVFVPFDESAGARVLFDEEHVVEAEAFAGEHGLLEEELPEPASARRGSALREAGFSLSLPRPRERERERERESPKSLSKPWRVFHADDGAGLALDEDRDARGLRCQSWRKPGRQQPLMFTPSRLERERESHDFLTFEGATCIEL